LEGIGNAAGTGEQIHYHRQPQNPIEPIKNSQNSTPSPQPTSLANARKIPYFSYPPHPSNTTKRTPKTNRNKPQRPKSPYPTYPELDKPTSALPQTTPKIPITLILSAIHSHLHSRMQIHPTCIDQCNNLT
jgi:hypothetical protein